jgi:hypothetical protein
MNLRKVVVHEVQRNRVDVILDLLAEAVREPSEAAHVHGQQRSLLRSVRSWHELEGTAMTDWKDDVFRNAEAREQRQRTRVEDERLEAQYLEQHRARFWDQLRTMLREEVEGYNSRAKAQGRGNIASATSRATGPFQRARKSRRWARSPSAQVQVAV